MVGENDNQPVGAGEEPVLDPGPPGDGGGDPGAAFPNEEWERQVRAAAETILATAHDIQPDNPLVFVGGLIEALGITACAVTETKNLNRYEVVGRMVTRLTSAVDQYFEGKAEGDGQ